MLIPLSSVLVEPPPKRPCQEICAPLSAQWDSVQGAGSSPPVNRHSALTEPVQAGFLGDCVWLSREAVGAYRGYLAFRASISALRTSFQAPRSYEFRFNR